MDATTTNVAQAISLAVDEAQEFGTSGGEEVGLLLSPDLNRDLRVTEVGAQLHHDRPSGTSYFLLKTSDGREWRVTVQEEPTEASHSTAPGFSLVPGTRVRSGLQGPAYNRDGQIYSVGDRDVLILWEGNIQPNSFPRDSEIVRCLQLA